MGGENFMAYNLDLRQRAIALLEKGFSLREVSELLAIGSATLIRRNRRYREGKLAVFYPKTRRRKINDEALTLAVEAQPDAYLHEIAAQFGVTAQGILYAMRRLKITRKKRRRSTVSVTKKNEKSTLKP
jgi:transposase